MINYIQIENFKSLREISLPTEGLNLLFGLNGMGKSSVLQMLLLLRQSFWQNGKNSLDKLNINGELVDLGIGKDIYCQSAEDSYIRFLLAFQGDQMLDVCYTCKTNDMNNDILDIEPAFNDHFSVSVKTSSLFDREFSYLSAEHIGPKQLYTTKLWKKEGINPLGIRGEYAVPFLAENGDTFKVPDYLCLKQGKTNRLFDQLSAWMKEISPGIKLYARIEPYEETARLDISYDGNRLGTGVFSPVNVGFGIPYVIPVITSLLISGESSLILMENPESHLHPRGQSKIGELMAKAAAGGAQIFCESHSDHLVNGVRVAVKDGIIGHNNITINYFDKNSDQETEVTSIAIDPNGNLSEYPKGLLDEWGTLMARLI